jgi:hypothetical protein
LKFGKFAFAALRSQNLNREYLKIEMKEMGRLLKNKNPARGVCEQGSQKGLPCFEELMARGPICSLFSVGFGVGGRCLWRNLRSQSWKDIPSQPQKGRWPPYYNFRRNLSPFHH